MHLPSHKTPKSEFSLDLRLLQIAMDHIDTIKATTCRTGTSIVTGSTFGTPMLKLVAHRANVRVKKINNIHWESQKMGGLGVLRYALETSILLDGIDINKVCRSKGGDPNEIKCALSDIQNPSEFNPTEPKDLNWHIKYVRMLASSGNNIAFTDNVFKFVKNELTVWRSLNGIAGRARRRTDFKSISAILVDRIVSRDGEVNHEMLVVAKKNLVPGLKMLVIKGIDKNEIIDFILIDNYEFKDKNKTKPAKQKQTYGATTGGSSGSNLKPVVIPFKAPNQLNSLREVGLYIETDKTGFTDFLRYYQLKISPVTHSNSKAQTKKRDKFRKHFLNQCSDEIRIKGRKLTLDECKSILN